MELLAPAIVVSFFFHWYVKGGVPVAATVKLAGCPGFRVMFTGWVVIEGAELTVRVAATLVTEPAELVTVHV